ncbi:purine NTPase, putative [Legionella quateirensis]|uniref:Purine NTPase n=2 Tax=Legionella quateirensis TaxID=45072 RepID=A0A378KUQ4_9GAMM|nr:purine NTPase [Legionella quateirensis]STY17108.1 purine NTPase, putative [Legionella quateirensis]
MLTKRERFEQWRGTEARNEQGIIDTVIIIEDYFTTLDSLSPIKQDLADHKTDHFVKLNVYGGRSFGAVAFCRFVIEETIDLMPDTESDDIHILRDLSNILGELYDNPRKNTVNNANRLIGHIQKLLARTIEDVTQLKQTKSLCFSLYYILKLLKVGIDNLSDWKKIALSAFIDLGKIIQDTTDLADLTEKKIAQIDVALEQLKSEEAKKIDAEKTLQDYFNERFVALFMAEEREDKKFLNLRSSLDELSDGISSLIVARNTQHEISVNMPKIQSLLSTLLENDQRVTGRQYFLELMKNSQDSFNVLMEHTKGIKKNQLIEKINQLKDPGILRNLSSKFLYGMSWATSFLTVGYRLVTSNSLQDSIAKKIPSTLDAQCKAELKVLATNYLADLKRQSRDVQNQITALEEQLSRGDADLKKMINHASNETLSDVLTANHAVGKAFSDYRRISFSLVQNKHFLNSFKETHSQLCDFIQQHDGWMVKLSNFLAQFFTFFKSETALLIDRARALKHNLVSFETEYRKEVNNGVIAIQNNPDLTKEVKDKFVREFGIVKSLESDRVIRPAISNEELDILIDNTSLFFNRGRRHRSQNKGIRNEATATDGAVFSF